MILQGRRIFYVEDNVSNRAIAQLILEREGAIVGFERWGRDQTIKKLRDFAPVDVILLDLMLPNKATGYDVMAAIRENRDFDSVPVVAVSAADPSIEIPKTRACGFAGFISKPIVLQLFAQQIATILKGEQLWFAQ